MSKILDYEEMLELLNSLDKNIIVEHKPIGYTDFGTPIPYYTYGNGDKHIVVTAGTHSVELITNIFVINLMKKLACKEISIDKDKYTIHFIPIYNPDGTIICTSAIRKLLNKDIPNAGLMEQLLCVQYYLNSRTDDYYAVNNDDKGNKLVNEMFKFVTPDDISDKYSKLRESVAKIIKDNNLPRGIMINWSSNGNGVDLNSNIDCGEYFERFKKEESEYPKLRYNQVNMFKVGPIGCPSITKEFREEPENTAFLKFLSDLKEKHNVIGSFIYHACGGTVHYLDFMKEKNYWVSDYGIRDIIYNRSVASNYAEKSNYKLYKPTTYTTFCSRIRSLVPGSLVVELSKLRSNPLSQFIDIDISNLVGKDLKGELSSLSNNYTNTINANITAFVSTIDVMANEFDKYRYNILVNKDNICPDNLNYKIVDVNSRYSANRKAEEQTFKSFIEFKRFALENGYDIDIESGYRSKEYQEKVFEDCVKEKGLAYAQKYVAMSGYSEHETGLAIDVCLKVQDKFLIEHDLPQDLNEFLKNNAYKYGFIIRYPLGKETITGYNFEPWHLRYVGKELAKYIDSNNLTLEEYYEKIKEDSH